MSKDNTLALVVRHYDEAIEFFFKRLNFTLVDDTYQAEQDKRWVAVFEGIYGNLWNLFQPL